jgi:predicted alpha/beta-fold hydrolase
VVLLQKLYEYKDVYINYKDVFIHNIYIYTYMYTYIYICTYTYSHRSPNHPIYLSGFSLGGNVILKFLGEQGHEAIARNIKGAAVFCVPFDVAECSKKLDQGFNKAVYSRTFLSTLKQKAERMYTRFGAENPDFIDIKTIRTCTKMGDFDEAYFCKTYGFKQYLHKIRVPAVAINAIDDPFIDEKSLPTEEKDVGEAPVRLIYTGYLLLSCSVTSISFIICILTLLCLWLICIFG